MQREMRLIFPDLAKEDVPRVLVLPVYQQSTLDLVGVGPLVEAEKDRLLKSVR
jgi:hypothetical protein